MLTKFYMLQFLDIIKDISGRFCNIIISDDSGRREIDRFGKNGTGIRLIRTLFGKQRTFRRRSLSTIMAFDDITRT